MVETVDCQVNITDEGTICSCVDKLVQLRKSELVTNGIGFLSKDSVRTFLGGGRNNIFFNP